MQQIRARTVPPFIRLTTLLAALAMAAAACSTGATSPSASRARSSSSSTTAVHGSVGNGSSSGGNGHSNGPSGNGTSTGGKARNSVTTTTTGVTTTTTGIPPLPQQFTTDDSAFEAALNNAQTAVRNLPPATTAQQVVQAMQPLMAAANLYQSQIVNLQWSASATPSAQSLTEDVGQLTADIVGLAGEEAADHGPDGIDARLVVAAAVKVDHLAQQGDHGVLLGGEPGGD